MGRFITDRVARARPHIAGEEVGQRLIMCPPDEQFGQVRLWLVSSICHSGSAVESHLSSQLNLLVVNLGGVNLLSASCGLGPELFDVRV